MYEAIIVFAITAFTNLIKKYVFPKWGENGIHIATYILSIIGTALFFFSQYSPDFQAFVLEALKFLAYSVALYEVILKKLPFFKSTQEKLSE